MFIKLISFLFLSFMCFASSDANISHNCSRSQFDEDLSKILGLFGLKGVDFPTNNEEMDKYCSLAKKNEEITKEFIDRCLTGYSKTLMFIFNNNLKEFLKQFCGKNPTERESFIQWSDCGNKGKQMGTNRCWNRLLTNLLKTRYVEDSSERIPVMCCNFLTWRTCTLNILKKVEECDENAVEGYDTQIKKSSLDVLQALCDEYFEEPTMCIDVLESMPVFDQSKRRRVNNKTPFLALFKIFDSLHD